MSFLEFVKYLCIYQGIVTGIQLCLRGLIHLIDEQKNKDREDAELRREILGTHGITKEEFRKRLNKDQ